MRILEPLGSVLEKGGARQQPGAIAGRPVWFVRCRERAGEEVGAGNLGVKVFGELLVLCEVSFGCSEAGLILRADGLGDSLDFNFHLGDLGMICI